jgi:hypothetical protein
VNYARRQLNRILMFSLFTPGVAMLTGLVIGVLLGFLLLLVVMAVLLSLVSLP